MCEIHCFISFSWGSGGQGFFLKGSRGLFSLLIVLSGSSERNLPFQPNSLFHRRVDAILGSLHSGSDETSKRKRSERSLSRRPSDTRGNIPFPVASVKPWRIDRNQHLHLQNQQTNPELCCTVYKSSPASPEVDNLGLNLILHNMAMLALKPTSNGISTPPSRKRTPKVEGDISSAFASLAGDKADALPTTICRIEARNHR